MASIIDPIKHVVVLMLENRSFDHMLGCMQDVYPNLDGIAAGNPPRTNMDSSGNLFPQAPGATRTLENDPYHEYTDVLSQISNNSSGFVDNYALHYPNSSIEDRAQIMCYYQRGELPILHTLAEQFTVCDHWFSSLPGPTWPNRLFIHSGTSLGRVTMPGGILNANLHWYDQTTVYDRLNQKNISWKIYYGDIPQSLILVHQLEPQNSSRYHGMAEFFEDAAGPETNFPAYSFIEPAYYQPGANDDHPPHDVMDGQKLIADVYNTLRSNESLWKSSLLVILYDEHGGFYDHVSPPAAIPPDHHTEEFTFDRLGVRVPAVLVSPYVKAGVVQTQFDHTSLLKYLIDKWNLGPLGNRAAQAMTFAPALNLNQPPREDTPQMLSISTSSLPSTRTVRPEDFGTAEHSLFGLTHLLESMVEDIDPIKVMERNKRILTGPENKVDVAVDRVKEFLDERKKQFIKSL